MFSAPLLVGAIDSAPFAAGALLTKAGIKLPEMRDPKALSAVAVNTAFKVSGNAVELNPLTLSLDGATITGQFSSPDLSTGAVRFSLNGDRLDLDRYLAPDQSAAPPSAAGAIPVALLRGLDVVGDLKLAAVRYAGLDLADVELGIKAQNSQLALSPPSAKVAGGNYLGNVRVDATQAQPVIRIAETANNVDLYTVLRALGVRAGRVDLRGGRSNLLLKATLTASEDGSASAQRASIWLRISAVHHCPERCCHSVSKATSTWTCRHRHCV